MPNSSLSTYSHRLLATLLIRHIDYESQLAAFREQLERHREQEGYLYSQIDDLEKRSQELSNPAASFHSYDRDELCHRSVYQDAAHSMAAVGMLAPFFESIFQQMFHGLQILIKDEVTSVPDHPRFNGATTDRCWDCHYFLSDGKLKRGGIVRGIEDLSSAVGLTPHFTASLMNVLEALFSYRNKMFHLGFEWPIKERTSFNNRIRNENWDNWFSVATSDGKPWIFYMTQTFVLKCVHEIDELLSAIGRFAEDLPSPGGRNELPT
jgi:hypothetical protein